jgi:hypothetical protein
MSQSILFLAHVSEAGNTLPKVSYEVLGAALKLTKQLGGRLTIGLIGADVAAAAETMAAAGAERILAVAGPDFASARYASDAAAAEAHLPGRGSRTDSRARDFTVHARSGGSGASSERMCGHACDRARIRRR